MQFIDIYVDKRLYKASFKKTYPKGGARHKFINFE